MKAIRPHGVRAAGSAIDQRSRAPEFLPWWPCFDGRPEVCPAAQTIQFELCKLEYPLLVCFHWVDANGPATQPTKMPFALGLMACPTRLSLSSIGFSCKRCTKSRLVHMLDDSVEEGPRGHIMSLLASHQWLPRTRLLLNNLVHQ